MLRIRFLAVVALVALMIPALGCGSRHRCCPKRPADPCCPTPGLGGPPPPPPVAGGF